MPGRHIRVTTAMPWQALGGGGGSAPELDLSGRSGQGRNQSAVLNVLWIEEPALELHQRDLCRPEQLLEVVRCDVGLEHVAAGENVHGGVPMLGPCVNREVRLGNHDNSAHAVG